MKFKICLSGECKGDDWGLTGWELLIITTLKRRNRVRTCHCWSLRRGEHGCENVRWGLATSAPPGWHQRQPYTLWLPLLEFRIVCLDYFWNYKIHNTHKSIYSLKNNKIETEHFYFQLIYWLSRQVICSSNVRKITLVLSAGHMGEGYVYKFLACEHVSMWWPFDMSAWLGWTSP